MKSRNIKRIFAHFSAFCCFGNNLCVKGYISEISPNKQRILLCTYDKRRQNAEYLPIVILSNTHELKIGDKISIRGSVHSRFCNNRLIAEIYAKSCIKKAAN